MGFVAPLSCLAGRHPLHPSARGVGLVPGVGIVLGPVGLFRDVGIGLALVAALLLGLVAGNDLGRA